MPRKPKAKPSGLSDQYLDPCADLAFKRVFGEHDKLLISFLNAVLPLPAHAPITSLTYLTPEHIPEIPGLLKYSVVDVKCTDKLERSFIVEMQMRWSATFKHRIVFGAAQAFVKQLKNAADYRELKPVYALTIVNDVFDHDTPEYYHHFQIINNQNALQKLEGLEFIFIELPKFKPADAKDRKLQALWLRFLSEVARDGTGGICTYHPDENMLAEKDIARALELVKVAAFTKDELQSYHDLLDRRRLHTSLLGDAEEKGEMRGRAEGKAEGKAEGLAEGAFKGKAEGKAEMVVTMLTNGLSPVQISQFTGLSLAQIELLSAMKSASSKSVGSR